MALTRSKTLRTVHERYQAKRLLNPKGPIDLSDSESESESKTRSLNTEKKEEDDKNEADKIESKQDEVKKENTTIKRMPTLRRGPRPAKIIIGSNRPAKFTEDFNAPYNTSFNDSGITLGSIAPSTPTTPGAKPTKITSSMLDSYEKTAQEQGVDAANRNLENSLAGSPKKEQAEEAFFRGRARGLMSSPFFSGKSQTTRISSRYAEIEDRNPPITRSHGDLNAYFRKYRLCEEQPTESLPTDGLRTERLRDVNSVNWGQTAAYKAIERRAEETSVQILERQMERAFGPILADADSSETQGQKVDKEVGEQREVLEVGAARTVKVVVNTTVLVQAQTAVVEGNNNARFEMVRGEKVEREAAVREMEGEGKKGRFSLKGLRDLFRRK